MKNKSGSLLIEILIYLFLSSIFLLLLFQFVINSYREYKNINLNNSKLVRSLISLDLITSDIQKSSKEIKRWKKIADSEIIFSIKNIDVGWHFSESRLYRIEGQYDQNKNSWQNKIESLAAVNLSNFNFLIYKAAEEIKLIKINFGILVGKKIKQFSKSVSPRIGLIGLI